MNRLQRRNEGGTETPDHSHSVCEDGLCSARRKFFYLLSFFFFLEGSNSPELNEPASDVPSAAVMRDFHEAAEEEPKEVKLGLVRRDGG